MLDKTGTLFSHVKAADKDYVSGGLRDFFLYRDLGIAEATHGQVIAHLVKANMAPEKGTGWHRHRQRGTHPIAATAGLHSTSGDQAVNRI